LVFLAEPNQNMGKKSQVSFANLHPSKQAGWGPRLGHLTEVAAGHTISGVQALNVLGDLFADVNSPFLAERIAGNCGAGEAS
jgi:hypothetical protein